MQRTFLTFLSASWSFSIKNSFSVCLWVECVTFKRRFVFVKSKWTDFLLILQKKSAATPAEYKKTDEPQPDVKEEEEEEQEAKAEDAEESSPGWCDTEVSELLTGFLSVELTDSASFSCRGQERQRWKSGRGRGSWEWWRWGPHSRWGEKSSRTSELC